MRFVLKKSLLRRLHAALSLTVVMMLAIPWAVLADNVIADGDGAIPIAGNAIALGNVCVGQTLNQPVLIAISRNGSSTGTNTFQSSSTVTLSVQSVSGAGLSAVVPSAPGNQIALPSNWGLVQNNTLSSAVTSMATFAPTAAGPVTGTIMYRATGTAASDGHPSLSRDATLNVTATVVACDTTPPVLSLPANITGEATTAAGAVVTYTATAVDAVDGPRPVSCSPASGSTFAIATTTVNCSASDTTGHTATGSFTVTVQDTKGPVIADIADITAEATSSSGAVVTYTTPTASDVVDGSRPVNCSPAPGSTFQLGTTHVQCTSSDTRNNTSIKTFDIIIRDTTAPVLSLPANITAEATGSSGATVTFTASATDLVDGSRPVSCTPASGSTFALGPATTVNCSASDLASPPNAATGSFTVTVVDTTPPTFSNVPTVAPVEATGQNGAVVTYNKPTASDVVSGTVEVTCLPASGSTFSVGTTEVKCTAKDAANNSANTSFNVTVQDTTPPTLTLPANQVVQATGPNGAVVTFTATAADLVDGSVSVTCTPASGSTFPIGISTVNCSATDSHNNHATGSFTVRVTYQLKGFYEPADPSPFAPTTIVWNTVKGGSTVPLKFEVFAGSTELTNTSVVQQPLSLKKIACAGGTEDVVEITATGNTALRYDATAGQFIYNWQTPREPGACYYVTVTLTDGSSSQPGTSISSYFKLK